MFLKFPIIELSINFNEEGNNWKQKKEKKSLVTFIVNPKHWRGNTQNYSIPKNAQKL